MRPSATQFLFSLLAPFLAASGVSGQTLPDIELEPVIECWYHSDFPVLTALVDPADPLASLLSL